jgi:hypothetical protein
MTSDDPMWNEFRPLWIDLPVAGNQLQLAGGYGLFLKQRWLSANRSKAIIVPMERWQSPTPRVTKDLDIVIGLELLASDQTQGAVVQAMEKNHFRVVETNPRWQFEKLIGLDRRVLVDFHAELPDSEHPNLKLDRLRIKHRPSLGEQGVHGRQNPEAAGCGLHPFLFQTDGITIALPNPVTWSVMKLIAARDRRRKSMDADRNEEYRTIQGQQAMKHAQDAARVVAMTTRDERDRAPEVIARIRNTTCFADAVEACGQLFRREDSWGVQVAAAMWLPDDFRVIRDVLGEWFR